MNGQFNNLIIGWSFCSDEKSSWSGKASSESEGGSNYCKNDGQICWKGINDFLVVMYEDDLLVETGCKYQFTSVWEWNDCRLWDVECLILRYESRSDVGINATGVYYLIVILLLKVFRLIYLWSISLLLVFVVCVFVPQPSLFLFHFLFQHYFSHL